MRGLKWVACWARFYYNLIHGGENGALSQRSEKTVMYTYELKQQLFSSPEPKTQRLGL